MENTSKQKASQEKLPPGFHVGVIPPDGTQLELSIWMAILGLHENEETAFKIRLNRDKIPHPGWCGMTYVDATHIRRIVFSGRLLADEDAGGKKPCRKDARTAKAASRKKPPGDTGLS